MVYKLINLALPRDASQQVMHGTTVDFLEVAQSGDLAFFDNADGAIIHVGILLNQHQIIHASGNVRIDTIDHQGIFNSETQSYSHKLRIIKRLI
jgi:cell wall-associated NlpC family hydrolase